MRLTSLAALVLVLALAVCSVVPAVAGDDDEKKVPPKVDAIAWLRQKLADPAISAVLYRMEGHEGDRWKGDGVDPSVPHHRLDLADDARAKLVALVATEHLRERDVDLLGHSFLLELYRGETPVARLDFHTVGKGDSCIFLIDYSSKELPRGSAVLGFEGDGRKAWLDALAAHWKAAAERR